MLIFRESVKLAAAYGIAVTGTMAITSVLFFIVARYRWQWPKWNAVALLVFFLCLDVPFLIANLFKFFEGGYIPVLIGASLIAAMLIWNRGRTFHEQKYATQFPTFESVREQIDIASQCACPALPFSLLRAWIMSRPFWCILSSAAVPCRKMSCCSALLHGPPQLRTPSSAKYRTWEMVSGRYVYTSDLWITPGCRKRSRRRLKESISQLIPELTIT